MATLRADRGWVLGLTGIASVLVGAVLAVTGFTARLGPRR